LTDHQRQSSRKSWARVAVIDPPCNLGVPTPWVTADRPSHWLLQTGLLDDPLLPDRGWILAWIRQEVANDLSKPVRAALLRHHHMGPATHGVVL